MSHYIQSLRTENIFGTCTQYFGSTFNISQQKPPIKQAACGNILSAGWCCIVLMVGFENTHQMTQRKRQVCLKDPHKGAKKGRARVFWLVWLDDTRTIQWGPIAKSSHYYARQTRRFILASRATARSINEGKRRCASVLRL